MQKTQFRLMVAACIGLGVVVWLDNRNRTVERPQSASIPAQEQFAETANPGLPNEQAHAKEGTRTLTTGNPLASLSKEALRETVMRPLFAPSRKRPPEKHDEVSAGNAVSAPQQNFELLGILRNGDRAIALLRRSTDGTSFRVETGDTIGGWRVAKVEAASVLLERSGGSSFAVPLNQ